MRSCGISRTGKVAARWISFGWWQENHRRTASLQRNLAAHVREFLQRQYELELAHVPIEQPPNVEFGEYALPLAFELAKLRKTST